MAAPLRIRRPSVVKARGDITKDMPTQTQSYMERLVKLIPTEVVALYLVGLGIIPQNARVPIVVWALVCVGLVVLVRARATGDRPNKLSPQWGAVVVSTISFVIWVYNMPGPFQVYQLAIPYVGSLTVLVWTFVVPYFYQGS